MGHHLSISQVKKLCVSALPENELSAAAVHTADCQSCHQRFVEELKLQRGPAPFNFTLEPEFWFRHDHLDFDDLVGIADNTFDEEMREIINIHLSTCRTCREDASSFLAFRDFTAGEMNVSYDPSYYGSNDEISAAPGWQPLKRKPVHAVAAIVLLAVAVLIGVIALNRRSGSLEAKKQNQTDPGMEWSPSVSPSPAPTVVSSPSSVTDSAKVAVLIDAGGEVVIDNRGQVTGLDQVSENTRQHVARAFLSEQIELAGVSRRLSGDASGLRGTDGNQPEFRLLYPLKRVVIDNRPVFRWEKLPGVSSYKVYVLDANGRQVAQSSELPSAQTHWKAPGPLRRAQIFSWVVTALVDGKRVVSPSASAPEMKFAILSAADFKELARLKKTNSHLALGVFYARVGLLDEAEPEFERLIKLNPQSELARKLLQSVRSMRKTE